MLKWPKSFYKWKKRHKRWCKDDPTPEPDVWAESSAADTLQNSPKKQVLEITPSFLETQKCVSHFMKTQTWASAAQTGRILLTGLVGLGCNG